MDFSRCIFFHILAFFVAWTLLFLCKFVKNMASCFWNDSLILGCQYRWVCCYCQESFCWSRAWTFALSENFAFVLERRSRWRQYGLVLTFWRTSLVLGSKSSFVFIMTCILLRSGSRGSTTLAKGNESTIYGSGSSSSGSEFGASSIFEICLERKYRPLME